MVEKFLHCNLNIQPRFNYITQWFLSQRMRKRTHNTLDPSIIYSLMSPHPIISVNMIFSAVIQERPLIFLVKFYFTNEHPVYDSLGPLVCSSGYKRYILYIISIKVSWFALFFHSWFSSLSILTLNARIVYYLLFIV